MSRSSFRAELYRGIQRHLIKPLVVPRVFKHGKSRERILTELAAGWKATEAQRSPIGWFHASSVGELEMLTPVIEKWAALRASSGVRSGVILTIFSESAESPLERLSSSLRSSGARLLFSGFSPWEGEWKELLARVSPDFVMTARYEAWPELWMSLGEQEIPLFVLGAKARSSLRWAKRACLWTGEPLPKIAFFSVRDGELAELRQDFPGCELAVTGDPRWERVAQRAARGNARARELVRRFQALPRPWGVLGSAWLEDLKLWSGALGTALSRGTLWVVPHRIDEPFVAGIESVLASRGIRHARVQGEHDGGTRCLVVNEMGFLAELYSAADWAYVGGGFSEGVHNTIEPAIYGIPVACGPRNAERFPEIEMLQSTGQLARINNGQELQRWLERIETPPGEQERARWKEQAKTQLGAADAVLREIASWVSGWQLSQ